MASLTGQNITDTYKDLLTVSSATRNQGIESSMKRIFDGEGTGSALLLSTTHLKVDGILNLTEQSSAPSNPTVGDLAFINDELYIAKQ